jgi:hypothetical protein
MAPLDPLDREILERALEAAWAAAKESGSVNLDSDEGLEAMLRTELAEIARSFGLNDSETLREVALERLPRKLRQALKDADADECP